MTERKIPEIRAEYRNEIVKVPSVITKCSGIKFFGKRIKSIIFTTDIAIIRNNNADAVISVYPFTPHPSIMKAVCEGADIPVLSGVGGGHTQGKRSVSMAVFAEAYGSIGVVVNSPTPNETIREMSESIDVPIIWTMTSIYADIEEKLAAGVQIINVSGAANTAEIVRNVRNSYPNLPIIATGGPNEESILETIQAGANAITYTPPTNGELFKKKMVQYRELEKERAEKNEH